jgi:hypothetical protein
VLLNYRTGAALARADGVRHHTVAIDFAAEVRRAPATGQLIAAMQDTQIYNFV